MPVFDCAYCADVCFVYGFTAWQTNLTAFYCFAGVVCSFFLWILLKIYKGEYDKSCACIIINLGGLIICRNQHLWGLPLSRYRKSLIFGNYHLDIGSLFILRNYYHLGSFIICRNQHLQDLPLSRCRKSLHPRELI